MFTAVVPTPASIHALAAELAENLGVRRKVRVATTADALGPATFGWLRPTVVLPAEILVTSTSERLRAILTHELIHVRRGDVLFGILQTLAQIVWWFYPLVRWANRRASLAIESCCDEESIAALGCPPARYARCLLDTLQQRVHFRSAYAFPGIRSGEVTARRLEDIMNHPGAFRRRTPLGYWFVLLAAVAVLAPGAALVRHPDSAQAEPVAAEPALPATIAAHPKAPQPSSPKTVAPALAAAASAPAASRIIEPKVSNVAWLASPEGNRRALRFQVHVAKGERFRVQLNETPRPRGFCTFSIVDENVRDAPVDVELKFRSHSDSTPGDPLLSQAELVEVDVEMKGARCGSMTTLASIPLRRLPPSERKFIAVQTPGEPVATAYEGRRVVLVIPKPKSTEAADRVEPRAELVVHRELKADSLSKPEPLENLTLKWMRHSAEIGSAQIEFRPFRDGESGVLPLPAEHVERILAEARLDQQPQDVDLVVAKLLQDKTVWANRPLCRLVNVGLKRRYDQPVKGGLCDTHYSDGELDLYYRAEGRQIDLNTAEGARMHTYTLHDFRITPFDLRQWSPKPVFRLRADGRAVVTVAFPQGNLEIVCDPATGFVHRYTHRSVDGTIQSDDFQFHPVAYSGKIVFPIIHAAFRYQSRELSSADILVIESAKFNESFPDKSFVVAAPNAQVIMDYRKDSFFPKQYLVKEPIADLVEYVHKAIDRGK